MSFRFFLEFESLGCIEPNTLLCSIYMDSVILLSVLQFSDGRNPLKEVDVSVIFVSFVLEHFTPDLSGGFKLTAKLESTFPERMSTIFFSNSIFRLLKLKFTILC